MQYLTIWILLSGNPSLPNIVITNPVQFIFGKRLNYENDCKFDPFGVPYFTSQRASRRRTHATGGSGSVRHTC